MSIDKRQPMLRVAWRIGRSLNVACCTAKDTQFLNDGRSQCQKLNNPFPHEHKPLIVYNHRLF